MDTKTEVENLTEAIARICAENCVLRQMVTEQWNLLHSDPSEKWKSWASGFSEKVDRFQKKISPQLPQVASATLASEDATLQFLLEALVQGHQIAKSIANQK